MSALAGIYAKDPAYCAQQNGAAYEIAGAPRLLMQENVPGQMQDVRTTLRIQRYQLDSGQLDCAPFYPRPPSLQARAAQADELAIVRHPAEVSGEHGFWVTVKTSYLNSQGISQNCQTSSLFQYPTIAANPGDPLVSFTYDTAAIVPACTNTLPNGVLSIELPVVAAGQTRVALCQDYSTSEDSSPACAGWSPTPFTLDAAWVPCDLVKICGVRPSSALWSTTAPYRLTSTYANLPGGCTPRLEVRLVDSAMNITGAWAAATTLDKLQVPCGVCPAPAIGATCRPANPGSECQTPSVPGDGGGGTGDGMDGGDDGRGGDGDNN